SHLVACREHVASPWKRWGSVTSGLHPTLSRDLFRRGPSGDGSTSSHAAARAGLPRPAFPSISRRRRSDVGFFGAHALSQCARVARMDSSDPLLATHFLLEKQVEARRFVRSPRRPGLVESNIKTSQAIEPERRPAPLTVQRHSCKPPTGVMTIEGGTAIVLVYLLVSMGVIIAFLLAAPMIGRFSGWLRQHRREQRGEE